MRHLFRVQRVSILLPVFNGEPFLDQTLGCVLGQTFQDWELLLLDDGSTDSSAEIARRCAAAHPDKVRYHQHPDQGNHGQLGTRVLGARLAEEGLIALLDQDDLWDADYLERHLRLWQELQAENVSLSYGPSRYWFPDGPARDYVQPMPAGAPRVYAPGELLEGYLASGYRDTPCPSCALIDREALLEAGRFEIQAKGSPCEDQYLWWHVAARRPVAVHTSAWARYRQHDTSAFARGTRSQEQADRAELLFLQTMKADLTSARPDHPLLQSGRMADRIGTLAGAGPITQARGEPGTQAPGEPRSKKALARLAEAATTLTRRLTGRMRLGFGVEPLSEVWGLDRGRAICRYYLEQFLEERAEDIRGHCLEFEEGAYASRFGGLKVTTLDVLHVDDTNPKATLVADLTRPNDLPDDRFDCVICTHVLHVIYELDTVVAELYRVLKPGGVLLVAVPHVSMSDPGWRELWRFTDEGLRRLLEKAFGKSNVTVRAYGNSLTAAGQIRGAAAEEFRATELDHHDPRFAVEICARAVKATC